MGEFIKPLKKSVIMHFIRTLEELLEASPEICQRAELELTRWESTVPEVLRSLRRNRFLNSSLKSLDALKKKKSSDGYFKDHYLAILLHYFSPETIYQQFGLDTFLWLLAYKEKTFLTGLWSDDDVQKLTGKNKRTMVRASITAAEYMTANPPTVYTRETIWAIADCLDSFQETLKSIDLESLLRNNVKEGRTLSQQKSGAYFLRSLHARENCRGYVNEWHHKIVEKNPRQKISVYLDVPMALSLFWNDAPAAVAGILPVSPETLVIYQLQGVKPVIINEERKELSKGATWGLEPLDWKKLLVESVLHVAGEFGFTKVGIQSGYDNVWRKCGGLPLERALAIYDKTAQRMGFKQRSFLRKNKDRAWYRNSTNYG